MKRGKIVVWTAAVALGMAGCAVQQEYSEETSKSAAVERKGYGFQNPVHIKVGIDYTGEMNFQWAGEESVTENAWMDLYHENQIFPEIMYEISPQQAKKRLSIGVMEGEYPDLLCLDVLDYREYVDKGIVADISKVFEKYAGKELKEYLEWDQGAALESLYVDGKLYGLPQITDGYSEVPVMFIRKDWLDYLGLEVPETMEELRKVAYAFTYEDPNGNGRMDTYGLAIDGIHILNDSVGSAEGIFNGFGCYLGKNGIACVEEEENIVWGGANAEKMKKALLFLKAMYEEGSLTNDFLVMDSNDVMEEAGLGRCGIWFGPSWGAAGAAERAAQMDKRAEIIAVPVPDGTGEGKAKAYVPQAMKKVYCISSQCEYPEVLIQMFNLSVKYQNAKYCTEDEYRKYYGDNKQYTGMDTSLIDGEIPVDGIKMQYKLQQALVSGETQELDYREKLYYDRMRQYLEAEENGMVNLSNKEHLQGMALNTIYGGEQCAWKVIEDMEKNDCFLFPVGDSVVGEETAEMIPVLKTLLVENIVKIITGDSVDRYDDVLKVWYEMGGQRILDEVNQKQN